MPYVLLLLFLAQEQPRISPQQKQVQVLVGRIRRLASAEPPVFGLDTRIKTADALSSKYPKIAFDLALDARAALPSIADATEQNDQRIRLVRTLAALDLAEAERFTKSFARGPEDNLARAYDQIYLVRPSRELITRGFAAGAFRMICVSRLLDEHQGDTELFTELIGAYPSESPVAEDTLFLLREARSAAKWNRALALEAIDKALNGRDTISAEAEEILTAIDPELAGRYNLKVERKPAALRDEPSTDSSALVESLNKFPFADAISAARNFDDFTDRSLALLNLSRREEITPQQRTSLASEALAAAQKLPPNEERLFLIAMISRDYARRGEMASAGLAAQILLETYDKVCECKSAVCTVGKQKIECLDHVQDFAEYLDEFKVTPESMSLENVSLTARLLVLELKALLGVK